LRSIKQIQGEEREGSAKDGDDCGILEKNGACGNSFGAGSGGVPEKSREGIDVMAKRQCRKQRKKGGDAGLNHEVTMLGVRRGILSNQKVEKQKRGDRYFIGG